MISSYPFACLEKGRVTETAYGLLLFFFFINPSLVLLRGVRSPTSDVLQLGYSVVITLLQFDFSLATVFLLQDSSKREVRRFDKREVRHPVLLFHVLKKGVGDRNFLWCFFLPILP